jgi:hypothetical protein
LGNKKKKGGFSLIGAILARKKLGKYLERGLA